MILENRSVGEHGGSLAGITAWPPTGTDPMLLEFQDKLLGHALQGPKLLFSANFDIGTYSRTVISEIRVNLEIIADSENPDIDS